MSSVQSFSYQVNRNTLPSGYSSKGSNVTINPSVLSSENCAEFDSKSTEYIVFSDTIKNNWFPNNTAHPTSISWSSKHRRTGLVQGSAYICINIGGTDIWTSSGSTSRKEDIESISSSSSSAVTSSTRNTEIKVGGYATNYECVLRWIYFTFYFTRYDFSATTGSNVSSASVSSSTGYDGDQITYSCVLASGATFDGWYNGSTRVSTSQSYTHTVNGADVALEARATASVEPSKSFSAIYGNSIVISQNQNSSVSVGYNSGTITSLTDSDRIKHLLCKDKYMATAVTAGGKTLNCGGKISGYNIPMLYCYGSWELNKGLVVGTATLADASGWVTTPFIPVSGKINVTVETGGTRASASMLSEYDSGFGYASYWGHSSNPRTFTLDTAASYIRCTFLMSDLSNCYIKDNTNGKYLFKGGNVT